MSKPSQKPSVESCCHLVRSLHCTECVHRHFIVISDSADKTEIIIIMIIMASFKEDTQLGIANLP